MKKKTIYKLVKLSVIIIIGFGISHIIEGILALNIFFSSGDLTFSKAPDILVVGVTGVLYSFFMLTLGAFFLRIILKNQLDQTKKIIITMNVVIFLNVLTSLIQVLTIDFGSYLYFYGFVFSHLLIGLIPIPILFHYKSILDEMNTVDKIGYIVVLLIDASGWIYIFQILSTVIPKLYFLLAYFATFGLINMILGRKLYSNRNNKSLNFLAVVIPTIGGIFAIILIFVNYHSFLPLFIIFDIIIIVIQIYYISKLGIFNSRIE
ncbi:MAG: hypothetical protein EU551_01105 [Promethearchaeota archaeon]|nr:MAG: hypothetical protein EU551_01105 [Candidatus Lokiarchaeota archaeon]